MCCRKGAAARHPMAELFIHDGMVEQLEVVDPGDVAIVTRRKAHRMAGALVGPGAVTQDQHVADDVPGVLVDAAREPSGYEVMLGVRQEGELPDPLGGIARPRTEVLHAAAAGV